MKSKGNEYFKEEKFKEAAESYSEAINLCPEEQKDLISILYQNRAACYQKLVSSRFYHFLLLMALDIQFITGLLLYSQDDVEMVIQDCTKSLALNKEYVKAYMRRAKAAEKMKNFDLALEDITTVCLLERYSKQESLKELDIISKGTGIVTFYYIVLLVQRDYIIKKKKTSKR